MKVRAAGPLLLIALAAGACATKKDVDNLSAELTAVRVRQDSVWATVAALEESVSRALENQGALVMTVRGDLLRQMDDMERQLVEIQELLGQSQVVLQSLRGRMEQRQADREFLPGPADSVGFADDTAREGASGNAGALYAAAIDQFRRLLPGRRAGSRRSVLFGRDVQGGRHPGAGDTRVQPRRGALPELGGSAEGALQGWAIAGGKGQPRQCVSKVSKYTGRLSSQ